MKLKKFTFWLVGIVVGIALVFHILFNCLNPLAPFECSLLATYGLDKIFYTELIILLFMLFWKIVDSIILQFEFQSEYSKGCETSLQKSSSLTALFSGGDMSDECSEIRRRYLRSFLTIFILFLLLIIAVTPFIKS